MRRVIHGVEINTGAKTLTFKHQCFDEMDVYRMQVAIKIMALFEYLEEIYINSEEQLYLVAYEAREVLILENATYSDDEAISIAADRLDIELIPKTEEAPIEFREALSSVS